MTDHHFWRLIGDIDQRALKQGRQEQALSMLIETLADEPVNEIIAFEDCLSRQLYQLDGRHYARCAGLIDDKTDRFLFLRCFVVARGWMFFQYIKRIPAGLNGLAGACDGLLYVAEEAWYTATMGRLGDWRARTSVSYETGSNAERWAG
jgi:hypothetical protein